MQMVKKIALVLFTVWFALLLFTPKEALYFKLEKELAKEGIEISEGKIEEGVFGLILEDISIYAQGVKVLTAKRVSLLSLLFYTRMTIDSLKTANGLESLVVLSVDSIESNYTLFDPMYIYFKASGESIGNVEGTVVLKERKVYLVFEKEEKMQLWKRFLKKDENGWCYAY